MTVAYLQHVQNLATVADAIAVGTEPTSWHLAALTGVCRRQVHRYIKTLRDFGGPGGSPRRRRELRDGLGKKTVVHTTGNGQKRA